MINNINTVNTINAMNTSNTINTINTIIIIYLEQMSMVRLKGAWVFWSPIGDSPFGNRLPKGHQLVTNKQFGTNDSLRDSPQNFPKSCAEEN